MNLLDEVIAKIEAAVDTDDFESVQYQCVEDLETAGVGIEAVAPLLEIYERHPLSDFGMPGDITHFAERFYGKGYEELLLESFRRRPTVHTAWLMNRCVNGEKDEGKWQSMLALMNATLDRDDLEPEVKREIQHFIDYQAKE